MKRVKSIVFILFVVLVGVWLALVVFPLDAGDVKVLNSSSEEIRQQNEPVFVDEGDLVLSRKDSTDILKIDIEIVENHQRISYGMMNRKSIGKMEGMLFLMPEYKVHTFWMRNTYIPLDLIFFDSTNTVNFIYENSVPLSSDLIESPFPSSQILEVRTGFVKEFKIELGTKMRFYRK